MLIFKRLKSQTINLILKIAIVDVVLQHIIQIIYFSFHVKLLVLVENLCKQSPPETIMYFSYPLPAR